MKTLTVSDIMALRPCYSESRVRELFGDRESLSLVEILQLDIPAEDRIWVLTRECVCDRDLLLAWVNGVADRAVRKYCLECGNTAVEAWARGWLDGTDRSQAAAAAAYAAAAAGAAARGDAESAWVAAYTTTGAAYVAYAAAYAAACAARAASESAWAAAGAACAANAASESACAAAAAREAERRVQVDDLICFLNDAEVSR